MTHTSKDIKIPAHDGGAFSAYIAIPAETNDDNPAPTIIMIQEIFGVNAEMRAKCEEYAAQGYIAICPDLFWRIEPGIQLVDSVEEELKRAFELFGEFDQETGVEDLKTTLGYLRNMGECNGKVGSIGFCLGGKLSYMLAAATDIDASVSYYGVGLEAMLDQANQITTPILLHVAGEDEFVPKDAQAAIQDAMDEHDQATVYHYAGLDHAFARGNGMHYNAEGAKLANSRTLEFLKENLRK